MRKFKKADLIIQAILILGSLTAWSQQLDFDTAIIAYFVVGGWQVISMVVHWTARYDVRAWSHRGVHTAVMCLLPIGALVVLVVPDLTFGALLVLLYMAPLLAIWYWLLCFEEMKRYGPRETP